MLPTDTVDMARWELIVKDYCVSYLMDFHGFEADIRAVMDYRAEYMAHQLAVRLRVPGLEVPPRLVAEYPKNGWNYLKRWMGLEYKRAYVYVDDTIVLPDIPLPPKQRTLVIREYRTSVTD